jgi:dUTP pyrophosphatase
MIDVRIKLLCASALVPQYKTVGSAGCDIHASHDVCIPAKGGTAMVPTGISVEVPEGYECQARPRSGLAKQGIVVFNSPGTVDSDFRGEMMIMLINHSTKDYHVRAQDRIAQLVFAPVVQAKFEVVDELTPTERGAGGWGSTGVR